MFRRDLQKGIKKQERLFTLFQGSKCYPFVVQGVMIPGIPREDLIIP
jgi:hypothetical protein